MNIFFHHLTHILGFNLYYIEKVFNYIYTTIDSDGIKRSFINSTKVIKVAKKYFNCSDIKGVELEDDGDKVSPHWESRILLGEYMNKDFYSEEQVISEFTLAFLEDTGYYKANYYTGGLMRYGKNKGCQFIKEKCVNNYEINPKFENEFYDSLHSNYNIDASCSSGRQSRTYFAWWIYDNKIPYYYQYFNDEYIGGLYMADYCPVARTYKKEEENGLYVGRCSNIGFGDYGTKIYYLKDNETYFYKNGEIEEITGEIYSNQSFCYQSSLIKNNDTNFNNFSKVVRAICYETFCSSKSLTVKIHDNYIVCPRNGGKIEVIGFGGFFLCPDYNLMCSGTVLCNDLFDCVEKRSEIKNESYIYDYDIKTSQNIERAVEENADEENNYELSNDGKCLQYCKQCTIHKKCIKCKNNYGLLGNKKNLSELICMPENKLTIGYYIDENSVYYNCSNNCEKCYDDKNCFQCSENYALFRNIQNDETICLLKKDLDSGYYLNNSVYYKCSNNCEICSNDTYCNECKNNYNFVWKKKSNELICLTEEELETGYYKENNSIYYECIDYCENCNNDKSCNKCQKDYELVGNKNNNNLICIYRDELNYGYYNNYSIYYECINNCTICLNDKSCENVKMVMN